MFDAFRRELAYALRTLRRSPAFTLTAILTLSAGIGLNTGVFSVVRAAVLRPLPYEESERLLVIEETRRGEAISVSYPDLQDWRRFARVSEIAGYRGVAASLTGPGEAERVRGLAVTGNLFDVLRARPLFGRVIGERDVQQEERVAVIGHALWRRLGADPGLIGQKLLLNGEPFTVVGVMQPGFDFPAGLVYDAVEYWQPMTTGLDQRARARDTHPGIVGLARIASGHTLEEARTELDALARRLEMEYPESNRDTGVSTQQALTSLVGDVRTVLLVLAWSVGLVLLIACANVASLLLVRTTNRQRELAIRSALGASRGRLALQLTTEIVVLSAFGGAIGIALAYAIARAAPVLTPTLPRVAETRIDALVLLFALGTTLLSAFIFGLAPGLRAVGARLEPWLRERGADSGSSGRFRRALLVGETALTVILLIIAGVLLKSFQHVLQRDSGVSPAGVLTFDLGLPFGEYQDADRIRQFFATYEERIRALPGVEAVGAISTLPFSGSGSQSGIGPIGGTREQEVRTDVNVVTPDYFRSVGIELVEGRLLTPQDRAGSPVVAVVDQNFARRLFPGRSALGQQVQGWGFPEITIVGVVRHVAAYGVTETSREEMYVPHAQRPSGRMHVMVRTAGVPMQIVPAVRRELAQLDRNVPIYRPRSLTTLVDTTIATPRIAAFLSGTLALVALLLAVIGMYGLTAFTVSQRVQEFGVRAALGASPAQVMRGVLGDAVLQGLLGAILGILISLLAVKLLGTFIYGVAPRDPTIFVTAPLVLLVSALSASLLPALRAARVDPLTSLRSQNGGT